MKEIIHTIYRLPSIGFMLGKNFYSLGKFPKELMVKLNYRANDPDMILSCTEIMMSDIWYSASTLEPLCVQKPGSGGIVPFLDYIEDTTELQLGFTRKTPLSVKKSGVRGR